MLKNILFLTVCLLSTIIFPCETTAQSRVIEVNTDNVSIAMCVNDDGELLFRHFGSRVDGVEQISSYRNYRWGGYGTDPQAYPAAGGRELRRPALNVTHADGDLNTELRYVSHSVQTPSSDNNMSITTIKLTDTKQSFDVELVYTAYAKENVIAVHSIIHNNEKKAVTLKEFYSSCIPVKADSYLLTHLWGALAREAQVLHTILDQGSKSIESRKLVRNTHTENPAFMVTLDSGTFSETQGEVIAGVLAWSGNAKFNFEVDEFNRLNITAGINPYSSEYRLSKGETFTTPPTIYTYSSEGAGRASRNLHDWARNYGIWNGRAFCPTLLNSWEGAYFDFDTRTITDMIDDAASMGLEMFVLDDGWFGNKYPRDNDRQGLGDWQVNEKKLPDGIDFIAGYAHRKGLKFGIWIEPEMVNPKSELAERHPDWIVKSKGRETPAVRNQWLLDLSNPQVQDFIFSVFDQTMRLSPDIDYIKWDANRHVENAGSTYLDKDDQNRFWIEYTQGFYKVMERIREKYPDVIIQSCASGGGRVEYGALRYFDEVWTSDNTDALSRVKIQYGTSLFYPPKIMGSHVSVVPNHLTGNITPLKFRFDIACAARLGMELQPKEMTEKEKVFARQAIESYKSYRDIVMEGDLYRVDTPYDDNGFYCVMYVAKDKGRAVVFAYNTHYQGRTLEPKFRLRGLDPRRNYTLRELNVDTPRFWADGEKLSGSFLENIGINPPLSRIYDSAVFMLEAE